MHGSYRRAISVFISIYISIYRVDPRRVEPCDVAAASDAAQDSGMLHCRVCRRGSYISIYLSVLDLLYTDRLRLLTKEFSGFGFVALKGMHRSYRRGSYLSIYLSICMRSIVG